MNTNTNGETKQLTPRIRLEHVNCGDFWRWSVNVDSRAPELFISRSDAVTFATGVDIGHACTDHEAKRLLEFVREHVEANANCVPLYALFGDDDTSFRQAVLAFFSRTDGGGIKSTELLTERGHVNTVKPTAGPWQLLCTWQESSDAAIAVGTSEKVVARVEPNGPDHREQVSNANMVAASLDLFAASQLAFTALDKLMGDSDLPNDNSDEMKACQALSAAMAKAKGVKL